MFYNGIASNEHLLLRMLFSVILFLDNDKVVGFIGLLKKLMVRT